MVRAAVQRPAGPHRRRAPGFGPLVARLAVHGPGQARAAGRVRAAHPPIRERAPRRRLQRQGAAIDAAQLEARTARRRFPRHRSSVSILHVRRDAIHQSIRPSIDPSIDVPRLEASSFIIRTLYVIRIRTAGFERGAAH